LSEGALPGFPGASGLDFPAARDYRAPLSNRRRG
jgi:hypothetical protein